MQIENTIAYLKSKIPENRVPDVGIICGSGLGTLSKTLQPPLVTVNYEDIPGFPVTTVEGHAGELVIGNIGASVVICFKGRFHYYEGNSPDVVALPVRVMAALGVKLLVVTNAAGGVNPKYEVGDVVIIKDIISFIALAGNHPLRGHNDKRFGPRFPAVVPFAKNVQNHVLQTAKNLKVPLNIHSGVYFGLSGPTYESPAEIDMIRTLGGDAVGMSTVFEVLVAAHCGLPVLGLSLITNKCTGLAHPVENRPTHEEVLSAVNSATAAIQTLVSGVVSSVGPLLGARVHAFEAFSKLPFAKPLPSKL